ncbi:MAG: NAD(P)H-hydrate dehydratase [Oscillospiraceae bacterium]|nr:NAD(P)H-hydrate dehydratase [Oscillospiraceae bacterium]
MRISDISISKEPVLLSRDYIRKLFDFDGRAKERDTNKGDFGKLLAVCGSKNMTGAAFFAAAGALRCGVGLLYLASEEKALDILQTKLNEPIFVPVNFEKPEEIIKIPENIKPSAVLIGPGLGVENSLKFTNALLDLFKQNYNINKIIKSVIFDADGINSLCLNINILETLSSVTEIILTPHPGEMARLCIAAKFDGVNSPDDVQKNRVNIASVFSRRYNCVLVLKGANTVISGKNGDIYINPTGNPGMSKGGSGDILAGMAASYCAQGVDPVISACAAVYLHGLAGDYAARRYSERGMLPSDMLDIIGELQK